MRSDSLGFKTPCPVDDRADAHSLTGGFINDAIPIAENFAEIVSARFGNVPADQRMLLKLRHPGNDSLNYRVCIFRRIQHQVVAYGSKVARGFCCPPYLSHSSKRRTTSSWLTVLPAAISASLRAILDFTYMAYIASSYVASSGRLSANWRMSSFTALTCISYTLCGSFNKKKVVLALSISGRPMHSYHTTTMEDF